MAIRFYFYVLIGFFVASTIYFQDELSSSREAIVVLGIGFALVAAILGLFVYTNRRNLNDITKEPTKKNVSIMVDLLFGKKRGNK